MIYNIVLVSGVLRTGNFFWIIFHDRLIEDIECNSCAIQEILVAYLFYV